MVAFLPIAVLGLGLMVLFSRLALVRRRTEHSPEWYERDGLTVAVHIYRDTDAATTDADRAAAFGWTIHAMRRSDESKAGPVTLTLVRHREHGTA